MDSQMIHVCGNQMFLQSPLQDVGHFLVVDFINIPNVNINIIKLETKVLSIPSFILFQIRVGQKRNEYGIWSPLRRDTVRNRVAQQVLAYLRSPPPGFQLFLICPCPPPGIWRGPVEAATVQIISFSQTLHNFLFSFPLQWLEILRFSGFSLRLQLIHLHQCLEKKSWPLFLFSSSLFLKFNISAPPTVF